MRYFLMVCLFTLLSACSSINDHSDSTVKSENEVTAIKKIGESDFEIRLVVKRIAETDNTFNLDAGIRYTGNKPEITISHGDPLFTAEMKIDGKRIGGPTSVSAVEKRTLLQANEWQNQNIILQSSQTQIKRFFEQNGELIINSGFNVEDYKAEQKDDAFLKVTAEEIPH